MFVEDLSPFFNATEMATAATLNGAAVVGIFDNGYQDQEFGGSASTPSYMLPAASVPGGVVGMTLVCNSITYKVVETMPDGTGITTLRLRT